MRRPSPSFIVPLLVAVAACGDGYGAGGSTTTMATGGYAVSGYAHAGPVCPVESVPPDPDCADRAVADAAILVRAESGAIIAETRTASDGAFSITLPPGTYTLVPQPVEGLMGTAAEVEVEVSDGPVAGIDFAYDTGIR